MTEQRTDTFHTAFKIASEKITKLAEKSTKFKPVDSYIIDEHIISIHHIINYFEEDSKSLVIRFYEVCMSYLNNLLLKFSSLIKIIFIYSTGRNSY